MVTLAQLIQGLQCPRCGNSNSYIIHDIDRTENIGGNTVTVRLTVGECTICGEQALDDAATQRLFDAVEKLQKGSFTGLQYTGEAYRSLLKRLTFVAVRRPVVRR